MSRLPLIVIALSLLTACGLEAEVMPAKEAPAAEPVLLITETAIGPVTRTTPFDRKAIQRLFRDSDVSLEFAQTDLPMISVEGPGNLQVSLYGKDGLVIDGSASGNTVRGPNGERVGMAMSELGVARKHCGPGIESIPCSLPRAPGLTFTFGHRLSPDPVLQSIGWAP